MLVLEHQQSKKSTVFENHIKKYHSTLRAKPKMVHFGEFLKSWSLRSNSVTRQVSFNRTKIGGRCQNSNATFWVIFKQCENEISIWFMIWKTLVNGLWRNLRHLHQNASYDVRKWLFLPFLESLGLFRHQSDKLNF